MSAGSLFLSREASLSVFLAREGRKMSEKAENVEGLKLSLSRDPLTPILSGYMWSLRLQCSGPYRVALCLRATFFFLLFINLFMFLNISPRKNSSKNDEQAKWETRENAKEMSGLPRRELNSARALRAAMSRPKALSQGEGENKPSG
jgi:hypothetical protein